MNVEVPTKYRCFWNTSPQRRRGALPTSAPLRLKCFDSHYKCAQGHFPHANGSAHSSIAKSSGFYAGPCIWWMVFTSYIFFTFRDQLQEKKLPVFQGNQTFSAVFKVRLLSLSAATLTQPMSSHPISLTKTSLVPSVCFYVSKWSFMLRISDRNFVRISNLPMLCPSHSFI
jgi:hypothetical protein